MIRTEGLVKIYGRRRVVDGVSLVINRGEVVGLLGPNGAGKTTTFYMIIGLIKPNEGKVYFGDKDITKWPMFKRALLGIGYLAQEPSIFRRLTVEENLLLVLEARGVKNKKEVVDQLLEEFSLTHIRKSRGQDLSGGERRRVEVARAMAGNPQFILLDEPFTGVDPIAVEELKRIITVLKSKNLGILLTDHNVRDTLSITDRSYIIYQGRILTEGPADKLTKDPLARKFYLGERFEI
ncbi:LPS export ABC transporter ATP-binding protein [bacterium]|nr:LPS export ABC transporter ATP-binding protein [bacterium]